MKLRQLEYIVAVCDSGSYTKAAAWLFVAQPSLSQQIRALETDLGARLLHRVPRGVLPTPAGAALLPEARAILAAARRARAAVDDAQAGLGRELTVLAIRSVASNVLPPALGAWHSTHPDTPLTLRDFNHRDLLEAAMRAGDGDVGIGPRPRMWSGPLWPIGYEEMVVVARDPREVSRAESDPHTLTGQPWVLFEPAHGLTEVVELVCARFALSPRVAARCAQVEAALTLSLRGVGLCLLPENVVPATIRERHTRRLGRGVFRELVAYTTDAVTPQTVDFVQMLTAHSGIPHRQLDLATVEFVC